MEPLIERTQVLTTWNPLPTNCPPPLNGHDEKLSEVPWRIVPATDIILDSPDEG